MRSRYVGVSCLGFLGLGSFLISSALTATPPPRAPEPRMTIDLGEAEEGRVLPFEIPLENPGAKPLGIVSLVASCGCTLLSEKPGAALPPGSRLVVRGRLDTRARSGAFESHVIAGLRGPDDERTLHRIFTLRVHVRPRSQVGSGGHAPPTP
jgi:hypothetical protein